MDKNISIHEPEKEEELKNMIFSALYNIKDQKKSLRKRAAIITKRDEYKNSLKKGNIIEKVKEETLFKNPGKRHIQTKIVKKEETYLCSNVFEYNKVRLMSEKIGKFIKKESATGKSLEKEFNFNECTVTSKIQKCMLNFVNIDDSYLEYKSSIIGKVDEDDEINDGKKITAYMYTQNFDLDSNIGRKFSDIGLNSLSELDIIKSDEQSNTNVYVGMLSKMDNNDNIARYDQYIILDEYILECINQIYNTYHNTSDGLKSLVNKIRGIYPLVKKYIINNKDTDNVKVINTITINRSDKVFDNFSNIIVNYNIGDLSIFKDPRYDYYQYSILGKKNIGESASFSEMMEMNCNRDEISFYDSLIVRLGEIISDQLSHKFSERICLYNRIGGEYPSIESFYEKNNIDPKYLLCSANSDIDGVNRIDLTSFKLRVDNAYVIINLEKNSNGELELASGSRIKFYDNTEYIKYSIVFNGAIATLSEEIGANIEEYKYSGITTYDICMRDFLDLFKNHGEK